MDERFITLDDPELGKRTYHEQHFFCAECGDPFLPPASPGAPSRTFAGDGAFTASAEDDVGFTVYKGHPYCEACHVRLRMPKCKKCKKSIRDGMQAVEALGGKWCWECFTCAVSGLLLQRLIRCAWRVLIAFVCRVATGRSKTQPSSSGTARPSANAVSVS